MNIMIIVMMLFIRSNLNIIVSEMVFIVEVIDFFVELGVFVLLIYIK